MEKRVFLLGKIREKESFSAAKEIVYSPVILNQRVILIGEKETLT